MSNYTNMFEEGPSPGLPISIIVSTYLIPYVIAYLAYLENTRWIRMALYPLGMLCCVWTFKNLNIPDQFNRLRVCQFAIMFNFGASTRWAFSSTTPNEHPLPTPPPYPKLRASTPFRAFNLLLCSFRPINLSPSPPLLPSNKSRLSHTIHHAGWAIWHMLLSDPCIYLAFILPKYLATNESIPSSSYTDYLDFMAIHLHLPTFVVHIAWTVIVAIMTYTGFTGVWHLLAMGFVGSGLYTGEEWPRLMDHPWRSSSLNELWGRRWHQTFRETYLTLTFPLSPSRPLHLFGIFLLSGILHAILNYTINHNLIWAPYMIFFTGNGAAIVAERAFAKFTGRRVKGWLGRIWVWGVLGLMSYRVVRLEFEDGWVSVLREMVGRREVFSATELVVGLMGVLGGSGRGSALTGGKEGLGRSMLGAVKAEGAVPL